MLVLTYLGRYLFSETWGERRPDPIMRRSTACPSHTGGPQPHIPITLSALKVLRAPVASSSDSRVTLLASINRRANEIST